jgi:hypothetical protein
MAGAAVFFLDGPRAICRRSFYSRPSSSSPDGARTITANRGQNVGIVGFPSDRCGLGIRERFQSYRTRPGHAPYISWLFVWAPAANPYLC